jgi:hypothetical protein
MHHTASCLTPSTRRPRYASPAMLCCAPCIPSGSKPLPLVKLVDDFSASWDYVANDGEAFTFKTNLDAPRYR